MNTNPQPAAGIKVLPMRQAKRQPAEWGELTWFASRELGNADAFTVGRCVIKPGQRNPRHYHPNCAETLVVISGSIRHTLTGSEQVTLREGDTVTVPPNVWHQAVNIGGQDAVLFVVFSSADRQTVGE